MKRSFRALIFAILCLFISTLVGGLGRLIGAPTLTDPNTPTYYLLMDLPVYVLTLGCMVVMLIGSPFAFLGYFKTKPNHILTAMIILAFSSLTFYGYLKFMIIPIGLEILGYFAYLEVKQLSILKEEASKNQKQSLKKNPL